MKMAVQSLATSLLLASAGCGAAADEVYRGMCDASAAVALGPRHFVVADDESDLLRIYQRGTPKPVAAVDLAEHLHNRDAKGKTTEGDIEGAAQVGNRIYWISSHARKGKDASVDPHRQRLFATEIVAAGTSAPTVRAVGVAYEALLRHLLADARFAPLAEAARHGPEQEGGLNIEGLASTADGGLLIGFRNPRPGGQALVVPLRNPGPVVDSGAAPQFGDLLRLDLGGRGIRSMERVGEQVLIVAGPHATAAQSRLQPAFALYRWSGAAQPPPVLLRSLDAGSERPEALFVSGAGGELLLLSDDGDEPVGKRECKHKKVPPDERRFRARSLPQP